MKNIRNLFSLPFVFGLILFGAHPLHANFNLVQNPSFEELDGGGIAHWPRVLSTFNRDTGVARSGNASLRLAWPMGDARLSEFSTNGDLPALEPGTTYVMRLWVKGRGVTGSEDSFVRLRFVFLDPVTDDNPHTLDVNAWSYLRRSDEWMRVETRFTTPPNYRRGRLDLNWQLADGDVAWVDDVSLSKVGDFGPPAELYLEASAQQASADGSGLVSLRAHLVDVAGNPAADSSGTVSFQAVGPGNWVGPSEVRLVDGKSQALYRAIGNAGDVVEVTAQLSGYPPQLVTVTLIEPSPIDRSKPAPYGIFESGNYIFAGTDFQDMIDDMRSRGSGMDAVMLTNGSVERMTPLFPTAETNGVDMFIYPAENIYYEWFGNPEAEVTLEEAKRIARPVVDAWRDASPVQGIYTLDEPPWHQMEKTRLMNQAFMELRPGWLVAPVIANGEKSSFMFDNTAPNLLLVNPYPVRGNTAVGSWIPDYVHDLRSRVVTRPAGWPMWTILQAHGAENPADSGAAARRPEAMEVRAQHWLAIGEGSQGIFWFIYITQQWWIGLEDNPALFNEIGDLSSRMDNYRHLLPHLTRLADEFTAESDGAMPYASTLAHIDGRIFVVAHNGDVFNEQVLRISSARYDGALEDLETGEFFGLGHAIPFRSADGRFFRFHPGIEVSDHGTGFPPGWGASVPSYTYGDVGSVAAAGSTTQEAEGSLVVRGSGRDISGGLDAFHFYRAGFLGDTTLNVRLDSMEGGNAAWAKAGLMMRSSPTATSAYAAIFLRSGGSAIFQARELDNGSTESYYFTITPPAYLRLVRSGNSFTGLVSTNGNTWTQVGPTSSLRVGAKMDAGLAVTSHWDGEITTARFWDFLPEGAANITLPTPPTALEARLVAPNTVHLAWDAVSGDPSVVGYRIYRDRRLIGESSLNIFEDTGLPAHTSASYVITSVSYDETESRAAGPLRLRNDPYRGWLAEWLPFDQQDPDVVDGLRDEATGQPMRLAWAMGSELRAEHQHLFELNWSHDSPTIRYMTRASAADSVVIEITTHLQEEWQRGSPSLEAPRLMARDGELLEWEVQPSQSIDVLRNVFFRAAVVDDHADPLQVLREEPAVILLGWETPSSIQGIDSFRILRDGEILGETSQFLFADRSIQSGEEYEYQVEALHEGMVVSRTNTVRNGR